VDARHPLAVVTPTLDGDVLAALALADTSFTTGQLHRMLPEFSEEGIRKVLGRLCTQGIVLSERAGQAFLYRFNTDHVAAAGVVELVHVRDKLLARLEAQLGAWHSPPIYAALFGSMARGSASPSSDVDIFLVRPDGVADEKWAAQVQELSSAVYRWTGNDARPVEFSAAELRTKREPLFKAVLAEGLTVAGSRPWFQAQVGSRK
jgi:predicted nucleotidyltransferase